DGFIEYTKEQDLNVVCYFTIVPCLIFLIIEVRKLIYKVYNIFNNIYNLFNEVDNWHDNWYNNFEQWFSNIIDIITYLLPIYALHQWPQTNERNDALLSFSNLFLTL